jgi:hypothetical protein
MKRVEKAKHRLEQFKEPLDEKAKKQQMRIKKDLANAQNVLSKAGV